MANPSNRYTRLRQATALMQDAGVLFTWYRYLETTGANAAAGLGGTKLYATGYITGVWQLYERYRSTEGRQSVGVIPAGQLAIMTMHPVSTADKLEYDGATYEVTEETWPMVLQGNLFYRVGLKRG